MVSLKAIMKLSNDDFDIIVPEYLIESSDVDTTSSEVRDSGNQLSEQTRSGGSSDDQDTDSESEYSDDSSVLDDILTNTDSINDNLESLLVQVDNLNENIVTLNENIKVGVGLLFSISVIIVIKMVFTIFNKILGLGNC